MAAVLAAAMLAPFIIVTEKSLDACVRLTDRYRAAVRENAAIALVRVPLMHCGYGVPKDPARFRSAFGNQRGYPFSWDGPVCVSAGASYRENGELRFVYAMPGSSRIRAKCDSTGGSAYLYLERRLDDKELTTVAGSVKNWVILPNISPRETPLRITKVLSKTLYAENKNGSGVKISAGERIHLLRALRVYCSMGVLHTEDFLTSGVQSRVDGVMDMRFDLSADKRSITIYTLVRGNAEFDDPGPIIGAHKWPAAYLSEWANKRTRFRLYAQKVTIRLPNCRQ